MNTTETRAKDITVGTRFLFHGTPATVTATRREGSRVYVEFSEYEGHVDGMYRRPLDVVPVITSSTGTPYATDRDVREQYVLPALGEFAAYFDVDAIVAAVVAATERDHGGRIIVPADFDVYAIAERHELV